MEKEIRSSGSHGEIAGVPSRKARAEAFRQERAGTSKNKQLSRRKSDMPQKGRRHR